MVSQCLQCSRRFKSSNSVQIWVEKGAENFKTMFKKWSARGQPGVTRGSARVQLGVTRGAARGQVGISQGSARGKPEINHGSLVYFHTT